MVIDAVMSQLADMSIDFISNNYWKKKQISISSILEDPSYYLDIKSKLKRGAVMGSSLFRRGMNIDDSFFLLPIAEQFKFVKPILKSMTKELYSLHAISDRPIVIRFLSHDKIKYYHPPKEASCVCHSKDNIEIMLVYSYGFLQISYGIAYYDPKLRKN